MENKATSVSLRVGSACAFGISSILIVFVNKILLTNIGFPSFLCAGIGQMLATIVILFGASSLGLIKLPIFDRSIARKIFPLPLIYVLNLISGLGGTQKLNLPMFTVLRRFSILMTMLLEYFILGVKAPNVVRISVGLMILGYDLSFDAYGYFLILVNDICTAANGVYMKQKLEAKELGKYGLLYYNALFMIIPAILLAACTGEFEKVSEYIETNSVTIPLVICFLLSCLCGFILNYSIVLCTHYNSALTTTCVGPIKAWNRIDHVDRGLLSVAGYSARLWAGLNRCDSSGDAVLANVLCGNLFVTYAGMFSSGDYRFEWTNFVGINMSVMGSILYTYVTFRSKRVVSGDVDKAGGDSIDYVKNNINEKRDSYGGRNLTIITAPKKIVRAEWRQAEMQTKPEMQTWRGWRSIQLSGAEKKTKKGGAALEI
ncbi:unnamed protein product [Anisakis simplex]|uniref:UDP-sugar transporter sqv-7 (inferred by orthology to a C. elegans protein) n=1 Tax=Anisakis simplex TaxID=6269 RepID=A0A0M3JVG2_ANISI|nr:unnamed protein product [Anisakis simplex]